MNEGTATLHAACTCPVCGREVPARSGKRGRPRQYCTDACSEVANLLSKLRPAVEALAAELVNGDGTVDVRARNRMRSHLMSMANSMNGPRVARELELVA